MAVRGVYLRFSIDSVWSNNSLVLRIYLLSLPKKVRKTGKSMLGITGSILVIYHHELDYMARLSVRLLAISARLLVRLLAILARLLAILLVILLARLLARLLAIGRVNYWPRRLLARLLARLSSPS